jgi:hypothetical protein
MLPSRRLRKVAVAAIGTIIVMVGVVLVVTPVPASLVIVFGMTVLAKEFLWARKLLMPLQRLLGDLSELCRLRPRPREAALPTLLEHRGSDVRPG